MRINLYFPYALFCLLILITACDRPECSNSNPIFEKFDPSTEPYKDELAKQLAIVDQSKLRYWLAEYHEKDGQEYLYCFVQGDGLCAKIMLTVKQWNKIEGIRRTKGKSYQGAGLKNLKFYILRDSGKTKFVYKDLDRIID